MYDEVQLLKRCQRGDRAAFKVVVETHTTYLFGTAYLMVKDKQRALDLVQETFIRCWKGLHNFNTARRLKPWLKRILINNFKNEQRRLVTAQTIDLDTVAEPIGDDTTSAGALRREQVAVVTQVLDGLPEAQKTTVYLRFYSQLSLGEIAEITLVSEGTVKSRLHRALKSLRTTLSSYSPHSIAEVAS